MKRVGSPDLRKTARQRSTAIDVRRRAERQAHYSAYNLLRATPSGMSRGERGGRGRTRSSGLVLFRCARIGGRCLIALSARHRPLSLSRRGLTLSTVPPRAPLASRTRASVRTDGRTDGTDRQRSRVTFRNHRTAVALLFLPLSSLALSHVFREHLA